MRISLYLCSEELLALVYPKMLFSTLFLIVVAVFVSTFDAFCPKKVLLAVGTYTGQVWLPSAAGEGLIMLSFTNKTLSTVAKLTSSIVGENPSYVVASHPHFYCTNENAPEGALVQVSFQSDAPFIRSVSVPTGTAGTTHVSVLINNEPYQLDLEVRRIILTANYDGSVSSFVKSRGSLKLADVFMVPTELAANLRNDSLSDQQGAPHPHMVLPYEDGVIVPDLGSDLVWYLRVSRKTGKLSEVSRLSLAPGDGPRHAILQKQSGTIYVVNEISLTMVVLRPFTCGRDGISVCDRHNLLDDESMVEGASAAAVRVTRNGQFLYASVRFPDETLGKIVGFSLDPVTGDVTGKLGEWSSHGVHPRDFNIIENAQEDMDCVSFITIVNRDSDNIVLVKRDPLTGMLSDEPSYETFVKTPTSVVEY